MTRWLNVFGAWRRAVAVTPEQAKLLARLKFPCC